MTAGVSIKQHEGKTKVLTWEQTSRRKTCSKLHLYAINRFSILSSLLIFCQPFIKQYLSLMDKMFCT